MQVFTYLLNLRPIKLFVSDPEEPSRLQITKSSVLLVSVALSNKPLQMVIVFFLETGLGLAEQHKQFVQIFDFNLSGNFGF